MKTPNVRITTDPHVLCKKLLRLERSGRYVEALDLLRSDLGDPAALSGSNAFSKNELAEIQLRHGSLVGFNGHEELISGSQDVSKDILMRARESFTELGSAEKTAECENLIALAYWRTGEFREAESWLDEAEGHRLPLVSNTRLHSLMLRSLVLLSQKKHAENIAYCQSVEADFRASGDPLLNGGLFSNIGLSLKDVGRKREALDYLSLARRALERSHHRVYLGTVENNLALLYKDEGSFKLAHDSVDSAIAIYKRIKDKTREGSSLETKAQISMAEGRPNDALVHADRSITVLRKSENAAYLAESLMTRAIALLAINDFENAVLAMMEAVDLTRQTAGEAAARELITDFQNALATPKEADDPVANRTVENEELELVLPAGLTKYSDYKGVWINNSHFEERGIAKGSLALVADETPERGDLVAAIETGTGAVLCGIYDRDFGMICLETEPGQPQLFDESEISIVGKIVGVCRDGKNADGKMVVEAISPMNENP